jgi:hypothetical protein
VQPYRARPGRRTLRAGHPHRRSHVAAQKKAARPWSRPACFDKE